MATRNTTHVLKNSDIVNRPLPGSLLKGEPIVNTAEGIVFLSGYTTTSAEWTPAGTGTTATFFEVGSNLYDLRLRNQITKYQGQTGAGLVGKFLSGTTSGFVLADISDIADSTDSYTTGATWSPNILTLELNNGRPSVSVTVDSFNGVTLYGTNNVNGDLTITGTTTLNGPAYYNNTASASNEIVNYGLLTAFSQTNDVYVTGSTLTQATDNTDSQSSQLLYHGTPIGGPYTIDTENTYTTGGTYNNSNKLITFVKNDSTSYTVDLSNIDTNDTYVTGGTNSASTNNTSSASIGLLYNQDVAPGTYTLPYTDVFTTGGTYDNNTKLITFDRNNSTNYTVDLSTLDINDTFVTGFTYNPATNTFTISQNEGEPDLTASINTVSGLSFSNLTQGRVVYVGAGGLLTDESVFTYDEGSNTLSVDNIEAAGNVIIQGDLTVLGAAISAFTSNLYVEDPNITLNYSPTGSTVATSVNAGITIQDGNGLASGDVVLDVVRMQNLTGLTGNQVPSVTEYTALTGYSNRGWVTQLNDLVIRSTDPTDDGSFNGVRVLAEFDVLDGGTY